MKLSTEQLAALRAVKADVVMANRAAKAMDAPDVVAAKAALHKADRLHREFVRDASFAMTRQCAGYGNKVQ